MFSPRLSPVPSASAGHTTRSTAAALCRTPASQTPFPALTVASATSEKSCLLDLKGQIFNALQDSKAAWDDTQRADMLAEELPARASLRRQDGSSEHSDTGPKPSGHSWVRLSGYTEQCGGGPQRSLKLHLSASSSQTFKHFPLWLP